MPGRERVDGSVATLHGRETPGRCGDADRSFRVRCEHRGVFAPGRSTSTSKGFAGLWVSGRGGHHNRDARRGRCSAPVPLGGAVRADREASTAAHPQLPWWRELGRRRRPGRLQPARGERAGTWLRRHHAQAVDPPAWGFAKLGHNFFEASDADLAFTSALIDNAKASLCIDTHRVYATGFSKGAAMSAYLGCKLESAARRDRARRGRQRRRAVPAR